MSSGPKTTLQPSLFSGTFHHTMPIAVCLILLALGTSARAQVDVWIDPGHGGGDNGNPGYDGISTHQEKYVTLLQSNVLYTRLGQIGYTSLLTRNSDNNYPTLSQRALMAVGELANDLGEQEAGQMFVSIHMNSPKVASDAEPFGTETYYPPYKVFAHRLDTYRVDSTFAAEIHNDLMTGAAAAFLGCNRDRGVKIARHVVTREARVPAVLIEVCFLTNQCQQTNILQAGDRALIANGIAAGISSVIVPGGTPGYVLEGPAPPSLARTALPHLVTSPEVSPARISGAQAYSEGFEGATFPPAGWSLMTLGLPVPHRWHRVTAGLYVHSGAGAALVGADSPSAIDEWLISPTVFLGPTDRGLRFFWNGNRNFASVVNAECLVRPVGAPSWTPVWSLLSESSASVFTYRDRTVDLTPWLGNSIEFAFRAFGTNGADVIIDDIEIGDFAPTAAPPNDACANAAPLPVGSFTLQGNTCYAGNDADLFDLGPPGCSIERLAGGDVFYQVNALAGDTLEINVVGNWFPAAYLMNVCDTSLATCVAMSSTIQTAVGDTAFLRHTFATGGTFFIAIDGGAGDCGDFQLLGTFRGPVTGVGDEHSPHLTPLALSVSPNPTRGRVTISARAANGQTGLGLLSVFDAGGRRVHDQPVVFSSGQARCEWNGLDAHGLAVSAGVYTVQLRIGSAGATERAIVVR